MAECELSEANYLKIANVYLSDGYRMRIDSYYKPENPGSRTVTYRVYEKPQLTECKEVTVTMPYYQDATIAVATNHENFSYYNFSAAEIVQSIQNSAIQNEQMTDDASKDRYCYEQVTGADDLPESRDPGGDGYTFRFTSQSELADWINPIEADALLSAFTFSLHTADYITLEPTNPLVKAVFATGNQVFRRKPLKKKSTDYFGSIAAHEGLAVFSKQAIADSLAREVSLEQRGVARKIESLMEEAENFTAMNCEKIEKAAEKTALDFKELIDMRIYMNNKSLTHEEKVAKFRKLYFAPKSITQVAISCVISSQSLTQENKCQYSFNLPAATTVETLAKSLGFDSIDELEEAVEKGLKMSDNLFLKKNQTSQNSLENADVEPTSDEKARIAYQKMKELGLEFAIESSVNSSDKHHLDEINAIIKNETTGFVFMPFKYNMTVTYSLYFRLYCLLEGYQLPFGRTMPNRTWLYIFSLIIDPFDTLSIKHSRDRFAFMQGGISIIENHEAGKKVSNIESYKELFQPILTPGHDLGNFKTVFCSVFLGIVKLQNKNIQLINILTEFQNCMRCISNHNKELINMVVPRKLENEPAIKIMVEKSTRLTASALSITDKNFDPMDEMCRMLELPVAKSRVSLKQLLSPARIEFLHFCAVANSMYHRSFTDSSANFWFLKCMEDASTLGTVAGYFIKMIEIPQVQPVLTAILGSRDNMAGICKKFKSLKLTLGDDGSEKILSEYRKSVYYTKETNMKWCEASSKAITEDDKVLSKKFNEIFPPNRQKNSDSMLEGAEFDASFTDKSRLADDAIFSEEKYKVVGLKEAKKVISDGGQISVAAACGIFLSTRFGEVVKIARLNRDKLSGSANIAYCEQFMRTNLMAAYTLAANLRMAKERKTSEIASKSIGECVEHFKSFQKALSGSKSAFATCFMNSVQEMISFGTPDSILGSIK